jgi:hypothetical protein
MADSIRQKIMNSVKARFQLISVANGYETALGAKVFDWLTVQLDPADLPALILRDPACETNKDYNVHEHELTVEADIKVYGETVPTDLRKALADVYKVLGTDSRWRIEGAPTGDFAGSDDGGNLLLTYVAPFLFGVHELEVGDVVQFTTTDTLPAGLSLLTDYYVVERITNTFKVSENRGGLSVTYGGAGTGTHTVKEFPDAATTSEILGDNITIRQEENKIGGAVARFRIRFRTVAFDPYTQP